MLAVTLLALAWPAQAQPGAAPLADVPGDASCAADEAGPPCGYILPILDLQFPAKPDCPGTYDQVDPALCIPLPAPGAAATFEGSLRWYWKLSEDGIYPLPEDIRLGFSNIPTNPTWLAFKVEPDAFTITAADLADPGNIRNGTVAGSPVVWFWYERPITVTITRTGDPAPGDEESLLESRLGIQPVYVKAKSSAAGAFYKESFGGELFRFDATGLLASQQDEPAKASPAPALGALLALVAVTLARRRRAS
jgi:hypothetical protein